MKLYDENEAVDFITHQLGDATADKDSILDVIDALYDYYEENDTLDFDFDEDEEDLEIDSEEDNVEDIVNYISSQVELTANIIRRIVIAEQKYQDTLL